MKMPFRSDLLKIVGPHLNKITNVGNKFLSLCLALVLVVFASVVFDCSSALAADKIELIYGTNRQTITLEDLEKFVETGIEPEVFGSVLGISSQDAADLRTVLGGVIPVPQAFLEKILDSTVGQFVLTRLDPVLGTEGIQGDVEKVAEALIKAAGGDSLSLLEVFKYYPAQVVFVNGNDLKEVYTRISFIAQDLRPLVTTVASFMSDLVCDEDFTSELNSYQAKMPDLEIINRSNWSNLPWPN